MLKTVINCHVRNRGLQKQTEKVPCTVLLNYFILLCLIFSRFLILFIYTINIGYWQVLFMTQEELENLSLQLPLLNAGGTLQLYLLCFIYPIQVSAPSLCSLKTLAQQKFSDVSKVQGKILLSCHGLIHFTSMFHFYTP